MQGEITNRYGESAAQGHFAFIGLPIQGSIGRGIAGGEKARKEHGQK